MGGYKLHCVDQRYSESIQLFDTLENFKDGLINKLDYIDKINDKKLNHEIDMTTFNQEKFNNTHKCKYCDYDLDEKYNGRKITP